LTPWIWVAPIGLSTVLLAEFVYVLWRSPLTNASSILVEPRQVGALLFGPYLLGVELASMLLLAGLVGAYHVGRAEQPTAEDHGRTNP
jgi:NADH-quinone oxidoreductase subunit J